MHLAPTDPVNLTSLDDALAYCGDRIALDLVEQAARSDADAADAAGYPGKFAATWIAVHRPGAPDTPALAA
jgi:hypothetical protein